MINQWFLYSYIFFSAVAFIYQDYRHNKDRAELLNRIMAKDWAQYQALEQSSNATTGKKSSNNYMKDKIERAYNLQYMDEGD